MQWLLQFGNQILRSGELAGCFTVCLLDVALSCGTMKFAVLCIHFVRMIRVDTVEHLELPTPDWSSDLWAKVLVETCVLLETVDDTFS